MRRLFDRSSRTDTASPEHRFIEIYNRYHEDNAGDRMLGFDMRHYLAALLTSEDRLSMAFSRRVACSAPRLPDRRTRGSYRLERKTEPGKAGSIAPRRQRLSPATNPRTTRQTRLSHPRRQLAVGPSPKPSRRRCSTTTPSRAIFDLDYVRSLAKRHDRALGSTWSEQLLAHRLPPRRGQVFGMAA